MRPRPPFRSSEKKNSERGKKVNVRSVPVPPGFAASHCVAAVHLAHYQSARSFTGNRSTAAKQAAKVAVEEAAEEAEPEDMGGRGLAKNQRRGSFKRFVAAAEESAIYAEEKVGDGSRVQLLVGRSDLARPFCLPPSPPSHLRFIFAQLDAATPFIFAFPGQARR